VRIRSLIFAAALIGFLGGPARATLLSSQGPTNTNGFSITDFRLADDFTLSLQSTVTDLLFYYVAQTPNDLGAVTYAIYANSAGALGAVYQSATIASGSVIRTGQSGLCPTCASATFSITPLSLAAGTYWLEVHAGTSLTDHNTANSGDAVDWGAVNDNATLIARTDNGSGGTPNTPVGFSGYNQYAFDVIGTEVPEPGALALLAVGLSILAVKARRRAGR
jgi:PEP-CTERM motif